MFPAFSMEPDFVPDIGMAQLFVSKTLEVGTTWFFLWSAGRGICQLFSMFLLLQLFSGELAAKGDRFSMFLLLQLFSRELPAKGDKFSMSEFVPLKWLLVLLLVMLDIYRSSMTVGSRGSSKMAMPSSSIVLLLVG